MKKKLLAILLCAAMLCTALLIPALADGESDTAVGETLYLSDITERITDHAVFTDLIGVDHCHNDGTLLHIGAKKYKKGLGMHCLAEGTAYVEFNIDGFGATRFCAEVGIQNVNADGPATSENRADIIFCVIADGEEIFRSELKKVNEPATVIDVDITGVKTLRLVQENNGSYAYDSGAWGDAKLTGVTDVTGGTGDYITYITALTERFERLVAYGDTVNINGATDDTPIHIGTKHYPAGIGMHCMAEDPTYVDINLEGLNATRFLAEVGIQNISNSNTIIDERADIYFYVEVDGEEVFRSELKKVNDEAEPLDIDITDAKTLRLGQANNGSYACDWGVWGAARLVGQTAPVIKEPETEPPVTEPETDPVPPDYEPVNATVFLSDITERVKALSSHQDQLGVDRTHGDATLLRVGHTTYPKGLGMHCHSEDPTYVDFNINGMGADKLYAEVGVQSKSDTGVYLGDGDIIFYVEADGREIWRSDVKKYGEEASVVELDIAGVKTLRLGQLNNGSYACDWGAWGDAKLIGVDYPTIGYDGYTAYLSDHPELLGEFTNYLNAVIKNGGVDETPIHIGSKNYYKGLGVHCNAEDPTYTDYNIEGLGATRFYAAVGIQNTTNTNAIVDERADIIFYVMADGVEVFRSDLKKVNDEATIIDIDITGVKKLRLGQLNNGSYACDWGAWGDASLRGLSAPIAEKGTDPIIDPPKPPKYAKFTSAKVGEGFADGLISISKPDGVAPEAYVLKWANAQGVLENAPALENVAYNGADMTEYTFPEGTAIPEGADRILIWSLSGERLSETAAAVFISGKSPETDPPETSAPEPETTVTEPETTALEPETTAAEPESDTLKAEEVTGTDAPAAEETTEASKQGCQSVVGGGMMLVLLSLLAPVAYGWRKKA